MTQEYTTKVEGATLTAELDPEILIAKAKELRTKLLIMEEEKILEALGNMNLFALIRLRNLCETVIAKHTGKGGM